MLNLNGLFYVPYNYTYQCLIQLFFFNVTEIDLFLCSKNKAIVYAEGPLINSATLCNLVRVACMWLCIKSKNTYCTVQLVQQFEASLTLITSL